MSDEHARTLPRRLSSLRSQTLTPARLALAGKAAGASALAWYLAPWVPFADSEYSYYAPLGVLVSMYPTILGSARAGFQALLGLALGIAVGLGGVTLLYANVPAVIAIAVVVGIGVVLCGVARFGAGRDWIAIAALFVLLLSGGAAEEFSASYLLTMAFGVLVGIVVTVVIPPPLSVRAAEGRLSGLRDVICAMLDEMAHSLQNASPVRADTAALTRIDTLERSVEAAVADAHESRRIHPRGRRSADLQELNERRMPALARVARATQSLARTVAQLDDDPSFTSDARESLARTVRAVADLVAQPVGADSAPSEWEAASAALSDYLRVIDPRRPPVRVDELRGIDAAVHVREIMCESRPFVFVDPE